MSTQKERQLVVEKSEQILKHTIKQVDPEFYRAFSNMLHDYIVVTSPRKNIGFQKELPEMIKMMAEVVTHAQPVKVYTTGELARTFGVSVQAVNKWIDEGRFLGFKREGNNRHNRIPETIQFALRTGQVMSVREVVATYETQNQEHETVELDLQEQRDALVDEISRMMKKYGGTYEMTLGNNEEQSIQETRDAAIWLMLLDELREMNK
ncbi:helix-turn-helix domain-containing protein [Paenibacillus thalictri]|uniref:DNA-binding protein n=1 Tax=Paenibacillus thalictri TaxID=2527873 RepID=A0A4Q9DUZ0_9BACL|nr:helix-turn-helix domain-containing protein [Paenibacillus thalictri]TBL80799.1 DNA-binding protein [Paenibacillus thalictri]